MFSKQVVFGGSTLPLLKLLQPGKKNSRRLSTNSATRPGTRSRSGSRSRRKEKMVSLSKTKEFGQAIDSEHLSELTEEDEVSFTNSKLGGFARLDRKYFTPFFTRIFSNKVIYDAICSLFISLSTLYQHTGTT